MFLKVVKIVLIASATLGSAVVQSSPAVTELTVKDMENFGAEWRLEDQRSRLKDGKIVESGLQCKFPLKPQAVGRDLDFILANCPLKAKEFISRGGKVICYFSFGATHTRPDSTGYATHYREAGVKTCAINPDWPDNLWLDLRGKENKQKVMRAHRKIVDSARQSCTHFEPDNMDVYSNTSPPCGSEADVLNVAEALCSYAKNPLNGQPAMGCVQKNAHVLAQRLSKNFDGAIVESCLAYDGDCRYFSAYTAQGKGVADIEYANACEHDGGWSCRPKSEGLLTAQEFQRRCARGLGKDFAGSMTLTANRREVNGTVVAKCTRK